MEGKHPFPDRFTRYTRNEHHKNVSLNNSVVSGIEPLSLVLSCIFLNVLTVGHHCLTSVQAPNSETLYCFVHTNTNTSTHAPCLTTILNEEMLHGLHDTQLLLEEPEWDHACGRPDDDVAYRKIDFETGQKVRLIRGEHDLFGDGSVVAIPTYGHTPGHQSLRVRTGQGEFVLCGDACYLRHALDEDHLPGIIHDREAALRAFALFRKMEAAGARILFGHDPDFWKTIPQAPVRLA